jgi:PAS domain S-box-containing protein
MTAITNTTQNRFSFRLFFLFFVPAMLLVLACAWYVGHDRIRGELGLVQAEEIDNVVLGVRRLDRELQEPVRHLLTLASEDALRQAVSSPSGNATEALAAVFMNLISYNPRYDQIRWIDETGMERLRVNNVGGRPLRVANDKLQDKAGRYYFKRSMQIKPGQVYISPLDLNMEDGKIEVPYRPVLRIATPVHAAAGHPRGVIVINVAAIHLLDGFTESMGNKRDHAMLLNKEGYWLRSPITADEWGFMFGRPVTLGKRYPDAWKVISSRPADQVELGDGLWTWSTVYPVKLGADSDMRDIPEWLIVSHLPPGELATIRNNVWKPVMVVALIVITVFGFLTAWLARAVAERNRSRIAAARAETEAEAAKTVSKAQERYQMVVKANVNGLLVADREGNIVLTNPALEQMFGYKPDELLGQPLERLVPETAHGQHRKWRATFMQDPRARPMGMGRVLTGRRKDGSLFSIEVSLSPFTEGDQQYVGAIVCDTSSRKPADN